MNFLLETAENATQQGFDWSSLWSIGGIVVLIIFFYFFMIRPQQKKDKEDQAMRDSLAVGDEVTTIGGIIGKVISIKEETFVLETTRDRTKIRFLKAAVRSIDVKIADVAASVVETQEVPAVEEPTEAPVEEAPEAEVQE